VGRGRDEDCSSPPAQIRTCSFPAYGFHLGSKRAVAEAMVRMRTSDESTPNPVLSPVRERWHTFPLASALRSTCSAADHSALFAGFKATMASSDFPRPYIIGYGSSPSRCGPQASTADGQTWDLPVSDAILPRVMCSSTPAGWTGPRMTVPPMLRSITKTISAPTSRRFRGSITHPTQQLCTLRGRRYRRLTQHSPPGGSLRLTWTGLAPANRASLLAPSLI